jgi:hypothetical protein
MDLLDAESPMNRSGNGRNSATLPILYLALASGVVLYAVIVLVVVGPLDSEVSTGLLRIVWLGVAVVATLLAGVVKRRSDAAGFTEQRAVSTAVFVWALAEGQAFLGLTGYLLTGDNLLAVLPLVLFAYLCVRHPPGAFRGPESV